LLWHPLFAGLRYGANNPFPSHRCQQSYDASKRHRSCLVVVDTSNRIPLGAGPIAWKKVLQVLHYQFMRCRRKRSIWYSRDPCICCASENNISSVINSALFGSVWQQAPRLVPRNQRHETCPKERAADLQRITFLVSPRHQPAALDYSVSDRGPRTAGSNHEIVVCIILATVCTITMGQCVQLDPCSRIMTDHQPPPNSEKQHDDRNHFNGPKTSPSRAAVRSQVWLPQLAPLSTIIVGIVPGKFPQPLAECERTGQVVIPVGGQCSRYNFLDLPVGRSVGFDRTP